MITKEQAEHIKYLVIENIKEEIHTGDGIIVAERILHEYIDSLTEPEPTNRTQTIILGHNDLDAKPPTKEEAEANIKAIKESIKAAGLQIYIK